MVNLKIFIVCLFIINNFDGNIIDQNQGGVNIISYDKTLINLSNYSTKSTVAPKIQEQSSKLLFECIISVYKLS